MLGFLTKVFGSKSERDIKSIRPVIELINQEYQKLSALTNDQLRARTGELKQRIADHLTDIDARISVLKSEGSDSTRSL
ncbi:MAG: hypothetical protein EOO00_09115, partial [Chitinophagaceae bacterium]